MLYHVHMRTYKPIPILSKFHLKRFWLLVDVRGPDECWPWKAGKNSRQYGAFVIERVQFLTHRISYSIKASSDLRDRDVLHSCDNPPCCNPRHLSDGTQADNAADMVSKGRSTWGEKNPQAVLTEEVIPTIREMYQSGKTDQFIADYFNISTTTARNAARGITWNRDGIEIKTRPRAKRARRPPKTICKNGHQFTPENTKKQSNGYNKCVACERESCIRYRKKKRGESV
jgi:hypothetical protein